MSGFFQLSVIERCALFHLLSCFKLSFTIVVRISQLISNYVPRKRKKIQKEAGKGPYLKNPFYPIRIVFFGVGRLPAVVDDAADQTAGVELDEL